MPHRLAEVLGEVSLHQDQARIVRNRATTGHEDRNRAMRCPMAPVALDAVSQREAAGPWTLGSEARGLPYRARAEPSHPEYPHPDQVGRDVNRMPRAQVARYWRFRQFTINRRSDRAQSGRRIAQPSSNCRCLHLLLLHPADWLRRRHSRPGGALAFFEASRVWVPAARCVWGRWAQIVSRRVRCSRRNCRQPHDT
jgi:hypothetical protein